MSTTQGVFGLEVPPGGVLIPAALEFPATIHISMAAIDPTAEPEADGEGNVPSTGRSTLRIVRRPLDFLGDDEDEEDDYLRSILAGSDDDDDDEDEDDEEVNGGPSDPSKARRKNELRALLAAAAEDDDEDDEEDEDESDEKDAEMKDAPAAATTNGTGKKSKPNGVAKPSKKGKEPLTEADLEIDEDEEESDEDEDEDDEDDLVLENFVLCTLDTERVYQQPLEITIDAGEAVFFTVSGSHSVHLTGNYAVEDDEDSDDEDEDEDDYDLPPDVDLEELDSDEMDELDELDAITGRIEEVDSDEEVPKLAEVKKGKNKKRPAEEDAEASLEDLISKESKDTKAAAAAADGKLSKKQAKKLKNNQGEAVDVQEDKDAKDKKRVQFAKTLEQGPTGSAATKNGKAKQSLGVKVVQGVTIDDRKLGTGRVVKAGDRVGMRYIGKLENGKVFDSNKKGAPFSFKVGKGEVIRGWDIGIAGMSVGGERRLTIPPSLAYGSKKLDGIPANSTLIFDVKLLEIK
ncbi:fkbp-type peptidyl-prolyl cis-trans isomerase [Niveomyces insectorum RCEF 264]|uniref:peptidylprolyl isomerase n=1 Tax=Niveomyces insectorum RCEF 264 TaxID=1081102 RepID=A0A168AAD1_9HYPO|nr:fkbp-type peptidyl-prolyl cis-trans isomerase [Niveomyces insectorum RCEF 264]